MLNVKLVTNVLLAAAALVAAHHELKPARQHPIAATFLAAEGRSRRVARPHRWPLAQPTGPTYTVTATVYQAVASQTDNEPFVTADNSHIKPSYSSKTRWLALSQDLLARWGGKFQYGDKVWVRGISPELDGFYTVHDTMNKRFRHCLDILTHPSEKVSISTKGVKIRFARVTRPAPLLASQRRARTSKPAVAQGFARRPLQPRPLPRLLTSTGHGNYFATAMR